MSCRIGWDGEALLNPGEYAKNPKDGAWYGCTPNGHLACLRKHEVTENNDGTISVKPSIKVSFAKGPELWHGFLTNGIWKSV